MMRFRPRAAMVGVTVAAACIVAVSVRGADADLSAVQLRVNRLEALVDRVEAISAIKRLQHAYGHYSELGLWHDFADLFADTGIGHYTQGALDREAVPRARRRRCLSRSSLPRAGSGGKIG